MAYASVIVQIADLGDRYPVPSYGLDVELLDRDLDGFLLGFGDDGPEALGAVADQINGPASHQSPPLLPG